MIVRIMSEGQYEVDGDKLDTLRRADEALLEAVQEGLQDAFHEHLQEAIRVVRSGVRVHLHVLKESDLVLPSADMTVQEARQLFDQHKIL